MPEIYWNLTSERVVTMEYVPGIKINNLEEIDRRGIDRTVLARRSAEAYLTQLCRHGFFHCDPHPGGHETVFFLFDRVMVEAVVSTSTTVHKRLVIKKKKVSPSPRFCVAMARDGVHEASSSIFIYFFRGRRARKGESQNYSRVLREGEQSL